MLLGLLLMNTYNFCFSPLVSLQVPEPYKNTAVTSDPKTLNLVLVVSAVDRHLGLSIWNACLAFPVFAWMSSSVPPFVLTILPRYVNSSTSYIRSPAIKIDRYILQAHLRTLFLQSSRLVPHVL